MNRPPPSDGPSWTVISCPPPAHGEEPYLVEALRRAGARTVEREGERFIGYFPETGELDEKLARIQAMIRAATSLSDPALSHRRATPSDWVRLWGPAAMRPVQVSRRLVVAPAGMEGGPGLIRLRPGPFFGTAEHATTRSCLRMLDDLVRPGDRIVDVGAGSGILAVGAALLEAREAVAIEMDPVACESILDNARLSGVEHRVSVQPRRADSDFLTSLGRDLGPFQGVVANIELPGLLPILPGLAAAAEPGGWIVLSGATEAEGESLRRAVEAESLSLRDVVDEGGWISLLAHR